MEPWPEFTCAVCLELLREPATLPCGHTHCLACIRRHFDRGEATQTFTCPQCRRSFSPRPALARSTLLVEAMEKLQVRQSQCGSEASHPQPAQLYPQLPVGAQLCAQHRRPLQHFCRTDLLCVCAACVAEGHGGHRVVTTADEREQKEHQLHQMQTDTQMKIQQVEKDLQLLPQLARANKVSSQVLQQESAQTFSELVRSVEVMGSHVSELLQAYATSLGTQVEVHLQSLQQEMAQLQRRHQELQDLARTQDHVCFIKNLLTLDQTQQDAAPRAIGDPQATFSTIRASLAALRENVQDVCKDSLAHICSAVSDGEAQPVQVAPTQCDPTEQAGGEAAPPVSHTVSAAATASSFYNPEPKSREELLKFGFEPTLDEDTAFRHLLLSDGKRKATLRPESRSLPEHPHRFQYWRQVLCREPLAGSPYYWEVEWAGQRVTVGVAYAEMGRKGSDDACRLGHNTLSWGLYWSGSAFSFWHAGKETPVGGAKAKRLGLYLDQQAGLLAFYRVSHGQAQLLHCVHTHFTGALYPGFRLGSEAGAFVSICALE